MSEVNMNVQSGVYAYGTTDAAQVAHAGAPREDSWRPFSFQALIAKYVASMQALYRETRNAELRNQCSQWDVQKAEFVMRTESIDKTEEAAKTGAKWEIIAGSASLLCIAGSAAVFGKMDLGAQVGNSVANPILSNIGRSKNASLTAEGQDSQLEADLAKSGADAHGSLISMAQNDVRSTHDDMLSSMRQLAQAHMDITKAIDLSK